MIKKKLLYFIIITAVLVSPIMYWMNSWWGVKFNKIPSIGVLLYVYSQDKFLLIVSCINLALYLIAIAKIFTMKIKEKSKNNDANPDTQEDENSPSFLNNTAQSDIARWENLYGNKVNTSVATNNVPANQSNVQPSDTVNTNEVQNTNENIADTMENKTQISIQTSTQTQPQPSVQQSLSNEQNNVVNIPEVVSARDVYKNMIGDIMIDNGYENIGAQVIANTDVDFVAIAESDTMVLGLITTESGDIIANEISNSGDEAPSWFTNEHKFTSPVWEIKNVTNMVQNMINEVLPEDNGIILKPIVVIPNAIVSNFEDIKAKWEEIGVDVVRFMNHSDLPNLTDVLPDKKGTEVLESYKNFTNTLMKYFNQKAKRTPVKKVG